MRSFCRSISIFISVALGFFTLYTSPIYALGIITPAPPTPDLLGGKSGTQITLSWSMACDVNRVEIQESLTTQSWVNIYTGQGLSSGGGGVMSLQSSLYNTAMDLDGSDVNGFTGPGDSIGGCVNWMPNRYVVATNKTAPLYYFRIRACNSSGCSAYSQPINVASSGNSGEKSLAAITAIPNSSNPLTTPISGDLVGEIQGKSIVDGGAFSYSVPLQIAPGRKGVQPNLSLNYSSQSGEGIAGMGWSLSANSQISRCGKIYDIDNSTTNAIYSTADKICLNGQRLVPIPETEGGTPGAYGQNGTYYQTERKGALVIQQLGGNLNTSNTYFVGFEPDGTQHSYGRTSNSKIVPVGLSQTLTWLQSLTQDTHGNEVSYVYDDSTAGSRNLADIYYTGHNGTQGTRNVHLNYTSRPTKKSYHWGGYTVSNKQLDNIELNIDGQLKAQWSLNYRTSTSINKASILDNLTYCNGDNASECLTTQFDWYTRNYSHYLKSTHSLSQITDNYQVGLRAKKSADYDGDGVLDLDIPLDGIYLSRTGNKVTYRDLPSISSRQWAGDINDDDLPNANEISSNIVNGSIDYDLDGADDFVYTNGNSKLVFVSFNPDGTRKRVYTTGINATCYASIYNDIGNKFCNSHAVDFDGDGRKDILLASNKAVGSSNYTITYKAYQRNKSGDGFAYKGAFTAEAKEPLVPMDVDGDGILDLAPSKFHKELKWYKIGINSSGQITATKRVNTFNINVDVTHRANPSQWADFNGDGLSDILTLHKTNSSDNFYTRYIILNKGNGKFTSPIKTAHKELAYTASGAIVKDPTYGGPDGYVHEQFIQFVDFNGDGRQDILYPDSSRRKYIYECWEWSTNEACRAVDGANAPKFYAHDVWHWNVLLTNENGVSFTNKTLPIYGALSTLSPIDLTGDGRIDFVSGIGFESNATKRRWYFGSKSGKPSHYPVGFKLFANHTTQDTVINSVATGMGQKFAVDYAMLADTNYPQPVSSGGHPYVNFTNTMRVVKEISKDNGKGSVNKTSYQYRNARFHVAGRGFQGFSDIIETSRDANNLHTITTTNRFSQTFPWSGTVIYKKVQDGLNRILSEYEVDTLYPSASQYQASPTSAWCFYPKEVTKTTRELIPNSLTSTAKTNVVKKTRFCQTILVSKSLDDAINTHQKTITTDLTEQIGWSVPLTISTSQTVKYKTAHPSVVIDPTNTATSTKITNTYRNNNKGVMSLYSTKTEGTGSLKGVGATTIYTEYDKYGTPLKVSTGDRYTKLQMTSDGYFASKSFNAQWGTTAINTNTYDALTGKLKTSLDIHGVLTTNKVNFLGQIESTTVKKGSVTVAPATYISRQWQQGEYAFKQTQQTDGQPTSVTYVDSLNRPVRTEIDGFDGVVVSATEFDVRGNKLSETLPTQSYGSHKVTTYHDYDALGRPAYKQHDDGMVSYRSDYTYSSNLTTDIQVSGGMNATMSRTYNTQGALISTTDANGKKSYFAYNATSLPVLIQDVLGSRITARYDDLGRKAWFDDPNMGKWSFTYNQFGELKTQKDARGITTTFEYDKAARPTTQTVNGKTRTWEYDNVVGKGKLYKAFVEGHSQTHSYDTAGRIKQTMTAIGNISFTEKFAYDTRFGRLKAMQYPSGEHVAYHYDDNGFVIEDYQLYTDSSEVTLREVTEYSAFGSINEQRFSNNKVQKFYRNVAGVPTDICTSTTGSCSAYGLQSLAYDYDPMGNLAYQHNLVADFKESYVYDELMRVDYSTKVIKGTSSTTDYDYDAAGNILLKSDYGSQFKYGNTARSAGGNAGPNAIRQFMRNGSTYKFTYDNNGNRTSGDGATITYDDQNKPLEVTRNGVTSIFSYDANGNRYKQVKKQGGITLSNTYYVGSFEREVTVSDTIDKTYIGDHTIKMKAHVGSLGNQSAFQHVLRDHLGSVDTLLDAKSSKVLQYRGYDVFGRPRDIAAGNSLLDDWQGVTKGYTDHEHLNEQQLIHMNGRIYDFNIGRFLSVDPFLQFPENSQSANPYSYILNNPMSGTDPSGYQSECTTGSNTGFEGFCSSAQIAEVEDGEEKDDDTEVPVSNGQKNEAKGEDVDWAKRVIETYGKITGEKVSSSDVTETAAKLATGASTIALGLEKTKNLTLLNTAETGTALMATGSTLNAWGVSNNSKAATALLSLDASKLGKELGTKAGVAGLFVSLASNAAALNNGKITSSEAVVKSSIDVSALLVGIRGGPVGATASIAYSVTDIVYGDGGGVIQLKRDAVQAINQIEIQMGANKVSQKIQQNPLGTMRRLFGLPSIKL
ncbi:SpvB/TcaC N-terminal domain-containing protein [Shewanella maritima]|uniref:SpvB/TcaC N-terminal domain-containing protein n=1 Tax=Shewanella maritima TaxID=2520507 RepID=UPI003735487A